MKKQSSIILILLCIFLCCSCSKSRKDNSDANIETYVIPVEIYAYQDLEELDETDKKNFELKVAYTLQSSESDKSLTKGIYDDKSKLVYLTFNDEQKKSYVATLKELIEENPATMYSSDEFKLENYSGDAMNIRIRVSDKSTFEKYHRSFNGVIDSLIQLQIIYGISYEDAIVTAEIIYNDGTTENQTLHWSDIY